jgi:hypothetical protein
MAASFCGRLILIAGFLFWLLWPLFVSLFACFLLDCLPLLLCCSSAC